MSLDRRAIWEVELYRPGITEDDVRAIVDRSRELAAALSSAGSPIVVVSATLAIDDEICVIRLRAADRSAVDELVRRSGFELPRVARLRVVLDGGVT